MFLGQEVKSKLIIDQFKLTHRKHKTSAYFFNKFKFNSTFNTI
jgi:hypothetical protein